MAKNEFMVELNLKDVIAEIREVSQAWNELADNLEQIEKKYGDVDEEVQNADNN